MTEPTLDPETTAAVAPEAPLAPSFSFCDLQREVDGLRDSLAKAAPAKKGSEVTVNALFQWAFLPPKVTALAPSLLSAQPFSHDTLCPQQLCGASKAAPILAKAWKEFKDDPYYSADGKWYTETLKLFTDYKKLSDKERKAQKWVLIKILEDKLAPQAAGGRSQFCEDYFKVLQMFKAELPKVEPKQKPSSSEIVFHDDSDTDA